MLRSVKYKGLILHRKEKEQWSWQKKTQVNVAHSSSETERYINVVFSRVKLALNARFILGPVVNGLGEIVNSFLFEVKISRIKRWVKEEFT